MERSNRDGAAGGGVTREERVDVREGTCTAAAGGGVGEELPAPTTMVQRERSTATGVTPAVDEVGALPASGIVPVRFVFSPLPTPCTPLSRSLSPTHTHMGEHPSMPGSVRFSPFPLLCPQPTYIVSNILVPHPS
jgi:hypothetical protein